MPTIPPDYVSDFVRTVMPTATEAELIDAQHNLDAFLDVIDEIYLEQQAQLRVASPQDNFNRRGTVKA